MSKTSETFGSVDLRGNAGCVVGALALIGAGVVVFMIGALVHALIGYVFHVALRVWSVMP